MTLNAQEMSSPFVWHPNTADEAWELKQRYADDAGYAAGGTWLRTQWEAKAAVMPKHLIDIHSITDLHKIYNSEHGVSIGAGVTLGELRSHQALQHQYPMLIEAVRNIAAPSIRNSATLGGNICTSTGDILPLLLAYNAVLYWYDGHGERMETVEDWLLAGLHPSDEGGMRKHQILIRIVLPYEADVDQADEEQLLSLRTKRFAAFHKIGRREMFIPSVVTIALSGKLDAHGMVSDMVIAAAGGQTIARRLDRVEQQLNGKRLDRYAISHAYRYTLEQYEPRGDGFASAEYRRKTAANLIAAELWKVWKEFTEQEG